MIHQSNNHHSHANFVPPHGTVGRLLINRKDVGAVVVHGCDSTWAHGKFTPEVGFSEFAILFGQWSLLMHEDEHAPLHKAASEALADAERLMDALHIEIHYPEQDIRQHVRELNIDGENAEWKQV